MGRAHVGEGALTTFEWPRKSVLTGSIFRLPMRLVDPSLTERLAEAGADSLLLSLHSHIPDIHDKILKIEEGLSRRYSESETRSIPVFMWD